MMKIKDKEEIDNEKIKNAKLLSYCLQAQQF